MTEAVEKYVEYVENTDFEQIQEEQNLDDGEIYIPGALDAELIEEESVEFIMLPAGKYEMLIRDSEKLAAVTRYVCSDKPYMSAVKALLEVE